jgi:Zn-dependent protease
MLRLRIRVGRPLWIPLWIHASWFAVLGLAVWVVTVAFGSVLPRLPLPERSAMALVTGLAFFACLAVHEVAHAVVARRFGVRVLGITLFLLGGVAEIEGELPSPGSEFAVALAGPATSIAIGSVLALASTAFGRFGWRGAEVVTFTLAVVNLGVATFNLVPGLPLDGGRILRAAIWRATGSFARATRVAAIGGRVVAAALVAVGVVSSLRGDLGGLWYVPMGTFIWFMARASGRVAAPGHDGALALTREGEAA